MKKLWSIVVLLAVATVFATSLAFFRRAVGLPSPWFGLMLMGTFLGFIAFARPLFCLRLPEFLRTEREWEMKGRLYRALSVPAFGALLRRTPLRNLNPMVYFKGNSNSTAVQAQIESAEAAHIVAAALLMPYIVYACVQGWWTSVAWLTVLQIGGNLYPTLHLRWVRLRIKRFHRKALSAQIAFEHSGQAWSKARLLE